MGILVIIKDLIKVIIYCFVNWIIPKSLKEFIIMVLCKEKKNLLIIYKTYIKFIKYKSN